MTYDQRIAGNLGLAAHSVAAVIRLLDEGNTLPFIARYRKEMTSGLDEEQIRSISELLVSSRALDERRAVVLASIEEQGKLTPELRRQVEAAATRTELEDLYLPYRPKRRTRASMAREKGLQPLAERILRQEKSAQTAEEIAAAYLSDQVATVADALSGARDIVAETISETPVVRQVARARAMRSGALASARVAGSEDPRRVYELYYEYESRVELLRPHQILALNRGEEEKILRLRVSLQERYWREAIAARYTINLRSPFASQMEQAFQDAADRLLLPAIEREVRSALTEKAGQHAISVFAANLRAVLSQPPLSGRVVMGIDPGFRTGSKVAVVDATGKVLDTVTIYPHEPHNKTAESLKILGALAEKHNVTLISIGNGTASRETEQFAAALVRQRPDLHYLITNEAGASVYSASPLARQELPGLDVSLRGAVSIARRVQDPLAELVKIDPKSIGVGLYQHDVDQGELARALHDVVESVVNRVGVDLNTASPALLTYVSGIGPKLAENIVAYRNEYGSFSSRKELRQVPKLGEKAFEQSAGFLRVRGGSEPLDASAIHPESYPAARAVLQRADIRLDDALDRKKQALELMLKQTPLPALSEQVGVGALTLTDILDQLLRPGRDPRQDLPTPILRSDVLSMEDLTTGMRLNGTVRNVVDFGIFIDIGVKQDGLLHRSQISPGMAFKVGDIVSVVVLKVEADRGRIGLGLDQP